jgi:hypothetical protein
MAPVAEAIKWSAKYQTTFFNTFILYRNIEIDTVGKLLVYFCRFYDDCAVSQ